MTVSDDIRRIRAEAENKARNTPAGTKKAPDTLVLSASLGALWEVVIQLAEKIDGLSG